ncbi:transcription factor IIA, alpha/beta subunit [Lentithecium fluviatile CBS 122367]|uniref:Transcription factor IIA, alpha/beta subunit n=1 Tax=Lentithecium fluviatile CBS 122367 TaxID=1168545 RepID=A0A6G1IHC5_9PLEO|nr:transcription factor IIA, alpha/beta subunit [Lentithecium fluviatile CBS 122367]
MSNQVVGSVYQQIIEKVIAASQNDFEEFGVDQSTLDEMKQGWQEKLSALKVASFPWDPQPEPQRQAPTLPSNVRDQNDLVPAASAPQEHVNFPNAPIKSERGYEPPVSSYPQVPANGGYTGGYNGEIAQQRAHALVAQRLQGQPNMPHPQHHGGQPPMQQQQYQQQQRMMAAQQQARAPPQMQQRPPQGHVYTSQTDGPGDALADWNALKAARAAEGEQGRIAADQFMRARVDALAAHQDSGLMMPLNQMPKGKKRKAATRVLQAEDADRVSLSASAPGPARFDGEDDDEKVNDSDAINSDLDDPEDDLNNGDDSDDETMDYMLCTYDKVQRVKNKWKCTLKDGILTTNKKEYLFHKANGEFEW